MAPSSSFPLLKLPPKAMESVFSNMNKMDLLQLSLTSKKAVYWIRFCRMFASDYIIRHTNEGKLIYVNFVGDHRIVWRFEKTVQCATGIYELGNIPFTYRRRTETMYCSAICGGKEAELMIKVLERLMLVFPGYVRELKVHVSTGTPIRNSFVEHFTENVGFCESLLISGDTNIPVIKYLMDNMKIGRRLEIQQKLDNFQDLKMFEIPELILHQSEWITMAQLKFLRSPYAHLKQSRFTINDVCTFLKGFLMMETPSRGMGWWKIEVTGQCSTKDIAAILPGRKWKQDHRDISFSHFSDGKLEELDCRYGVDIERYDNLLATVLATSGFITTVHVIIWHDRFPAKKNIAKHAAAIPKVIDDHCQRNTTIEKNLREMHQMKKKIDSLRAENLKLKAENAELLRDKTEHEKTTEQFHRVCGRF